MLLHEWNIRSLREEDLEQVGGWINALSGVPAGNYLQAINLLKMEWQAAQISSRGGYYLVSYGNEPVLHITLVKRPQGALLFVLMNPAYDEDEMSWLYSWRTALDFFYGSAGLTHLCVRISPQDYVQIKVLKLLGFRDSDVPGEYVSDERAWVNNGTLIPK